MEFVSSISRHRWVVATLLVLLLLGLQGCGSPPPVTEVTPEPPPEPIVWTSGTPPTPDALRADAEAANLVICVIDAARADHVGTYGYPRETTPNIDRLAGESVVFGQHFVPYPQTKPSTVSLFTGQYTDTHCAFEARAVDETLFTMAQGLGAVGFATALFSSNPAASPTVGVGMHFDQTFFGKPLEPLRRRGTHAGGGDTRDKQWRTPEWLVEQFSSWLATPRETRFFAYLHFLPPHTPYDAPDDTKERFAYEQPPDAWQGEFEFLEVDPKSLGGPVYPLEEWVNLYDANMRWADWGVGEVERLLRESGVLDDTVFVVTSDHGEAFGEHGYTYHTRGVYDELMRVPLLIRLPGRERPVARVSALTQTVDILPTVFDLFAIPYPGETAQGHSLLPILTGEAEKVRDHIYATCRGPHRSYLVRDHFSSLILYEGGKLRALYHLASDPSQTRNVIAEQPGQADAMIAAFRRFAATQRLSPLNFVDPDARAEPLPPARDIELSDEARRELEALGYID